MPDGTGRREAREIWWGVLEIIAAIILSVGASVVTTQSRLAVAEAKVEMLERSRVEALGEREKIGDGIKTVDVRLQRIEQAMARVEAKLEAP